MSSSTPSDVMMSNIMDKYQSLNRGIEEARRDISQIVDSKDILIRQVEQLRHEREIMKQRITKASSELAQLQQEVKTQSAPTTPCELHGRSSSAVTQQQRLVFAKEHIEMQCRIFCEQSRAFRATIKQLKLISTECGHEMAMRLAFLQIHGIQTTDSVSQEDLEHNDRVGTLSIEQLQDEWHEDAMLAEPQTTDFIMEDFKDPIQMASTSYQRAFIARQETENSFNECRIALGEAQDRATRRARKRATLQTQLQRHQTSIQHLEKEISETLEQTHELQALTAMYRQRFQRAPVWKGGVQSRNLPSKQALQPQQHHGRPLNPYIVHRGGSADTRHCPQHGFRATQQHPHLVGSIRMDRQFGGASIGIAIGGNHVASSVVGGDSDDEDDINDFVPFRRTR